MRAAAVVAPMAIAILFLLDILVFYRPVGIVGVFVMGIVQGASLFVRSPFGAVPLRWKSVGPLVLGVALAAVLPVLVVSFVFGKADIFAFLFNLNFGIGGTPWPLYYAPIAYSLAILTVLLVGLWRLRSLVQRLPFAWTLLGLSLLAANPIARETAAMRLSGLTGDGGSLMTRYAPPTLAVAETPPNLVFLFLEGFDRQFVDPRLFGDIGASLRAVEADALSFTDVAQIEGTGWSAAGHLAAWCGLPMLPKMDGFSASTEIVPHVDCLPNVLADQGYAQVYLSGAQVKAEKYFGFDNFLRSREFDAVRDSLELEPLFSSTPRTLAERYWGVYDSELLEVMSDEIAARAQQDEPFAIYAGTMDMHGPKAGISPACTETGLGELREDMAESVTCVSKIVSTFVRELLERHADDDLLIVVTSDHLAHKNNLTTRLDPADRRNYVMMIGAGLEAGVDDTPGSMIDLFPTVLDAMGLLAETEGHGGLGRSLLRDAPTLVGEHGIDGLNDQLRSDLELARFIWE